MTAQLLTEYFHLLAAAPNGVQKLRELILNLAVRGKLVPQDPNDEPASELLKRIRAEKAQLIAEGRIKKEKLLTKIGGDENPFDLPKGWVWVRLGDALRKITDGTHHSPPNGVIGSYKYISAKNIKSWGLDLSDVTYVSAEVHDEIFARCNPEFGDVLYIKDGATTGIATINTLNEPFSMLSSVALLKPGIGLDNRYLLRTLTAPFFYDEMRAGMTGVAITRVTLSKLNNAVIPLPPLAEQRRIVAKVDELMRLCDQLETQQTTQGKAHERLVTTLLDTLIQSADAEAFAENWSRIAEHFDLLFDTPESVGRLKQAILQLAVQGKLVPQNPSDEPASELLKRIQAEKERLIAEGKIKKDKLLPAIGDDEKPCDLPNGWEWARFVEYALEVSTGPFGSMLHQSDYVAEGIPLINPSHMVNGRIEPEVNVAVTTEKAAELSAYRLFAGDIVMARRGEVGRMALVTPVEEGWLCGTGSFVLRFSTEVSRDFIIKLFRCHSVRSYLAEEAVGTTMTNLNHGILKRMPIALPPIAEQHRIVAEINELFAICDILSEKLATRRELSQRLMDAVAEAAVASKPRTRNADLQSQLGRAQKSEHAVSQQGEETLSLSITLAP